MSLTSKREAFAQAIADGCSQSEAYRKAYSASNMKPETVQNNAYKLLKSNEVSTRVAELRQAVADRGLWTREDSVRTLKDVAQGVDSRAGEIVSAIKELNSMHGFNAPTKHEVGMAVTMNVSFD
jgi:phage terminase small subunit